MSESLIRINLQEDKESNKSDSLPVKSGNQPPHPNQLNEESNSESEPNPKKPKLEDVGYGPGVPFPPDPRPDFGGSNSKADDLFWEIKMAIMKDKAGHLDNHHITNISKIISENPKIINQKATAFCIPLISEAVCAGSLNVTKELMKFNPDLLLTNSFGDTPLKRCLTFIKNGNTPSENCCIELLKAHWKAGTIDTSVFKQKIVEPDNWNQFLCDLAGIPYESI
jgi:hypothetical protein